MELRSCMNIFRGQLWFSLRTDGEGKKFLVSDRESIIETCVRLSWCVDHREWNDAVGLLAESVLLDYTSVDGGEPQHLTSAKLIQEVASLLSQFEATQHIQSGHLVTIENASAICTANVLSFLKLSNPHGSPLRSIGGTCRFELNRIAGAWKIHSWVFTQSWADGNHGIMALAAAAKTEAGRK